MSTYVSSVDPPDLGMLPTFRRLLRLWREQWKLGAFGLACSFVYTLISIAIPILIQRAIDDAIVPHDESKLPPYIAAIGGLALLRFVIAFNRRYATARIGVRIEARMRELLYHAYLGYPRAFYDRHATGQVLTPGASAEGRCHRGGRRGGRRDRDGAGLRPRERRARALRREGRGRPFRRARPGHGRSAACARPLLPARTLDRRRRVLRRPRGHPRGHHDRRVRPLRDAAPPARVAARGDRLDPRPGAAGTRFGRPQLRLARRDRASARADEPSPPSGAGSVG